MAASRHVDRQRIHGICRPRRYRLLATGFITANNKTSTDRARVELAMAWANILSMPYAVISGALPAERMRVYRASTLLHRHPRDSRRADVWPDREELARRGIVHAIDGRLYVYMRDYRSFSAVGEGIPSDPPRSELLLGRFFARAQRLDLGSFPASVRFLILPKAFGVSR